MLFIFVHSLSTLDFRYLLRLLCCSYEIAAEQKALKTYNYLLDLTEDPDVIAPLKFLRERETVHFQRFGEALDIVRDYLNENNFFVMPKPNFMND